MIMARTYKTLSLSLSLPPGVVHELIVMGRSSKRTGARVAAEIVLREVEAQSRPQGGENRRRLVMLVTADTKLHMAARLVNEVIDDVAGSGILPPEEVQKIGLDMTAYLRRVASAVELIFLTKESDEHDESHER